MLGFEFKGNMEDQKRRGKGPLLDQGNLMALLIGTKINLSEEVTQRSLHLSLIG